MRREQDPTFQLLAQRRRRSSVNSPIAHDGGQSYRPPPGRLNNNPNRQRLSAGHQSRGSSSGGGLLGGEVFLRFTHQIEASGDADQVFLAHGTVRDRQRIL